MPTRAQKRPRGSVGGAAAEPLTLAETKIHLRVDHANDDTYIGDLIIAATDYTEDVTSRSLVEKTYDLYFEQFPRSDDGAIAIPAPPLISITSIKYYDEADNEQTWSSGEYVVDTDQPYCGIVYPGRNYSWPSVRLFRKSIHIEYIAGYSNSGASPIDWADNIPLTLKQAMLLLIGHLYENREMTTAGIQIKDVPTSYDALIANCRVRAF